MPLNEFLNKNKKNNTGYIFVIVSLMLLMLPLASEAVITNPSVALTQDLAGNGIAAIGDTITLSCRSTTANSDDFPYVDLSVLGQPNFRLTNNVGTHYWGELTISAGNLQNVTPTFLFWDEDGPQAATGLVFNNRKPNSVVGPVISGASGPSGEFTAKDNLMITLALSTSADTHTVVANLSNIGMGVNRVMTRVSGSPDSAPEYSLSLPFAPGKEGTDTEITVTITNVAGNTNSWTRYVSYDTIIPVIESVLATNWTAGKEWITGGDTIRIQATIAAWDNDIVVVYNDDLFPGNPRQMNKISGSVVGGLAVYEYNYPVALDTLPHSNTTFFTVRATDKVGNQGDPMVSNTVKFDNIPPEFDGNARIRIFRKGVEEFGQIAIVGDTLKFSGDLSSIMTDLILTVDLSAIGGVANQVLELAPASTTFSLDYLVHQYTSEPHLPRNFVIKARDHAGNEISTITLPTIYVANNPPRISAGQVRNATRPGQPLKHGDRIAIEVNVVNLSTGGEVWVDLQRLGGDAKTQLSLVSANTYKIEHVVTDPIAGLPYKNESVSFVIKVKDIYGNEGEIVTNSIIINNDPPLVMTSGYMKNDNPVTPPFAPTEPYAKIGDKLTFWVMLHPPEEDNTAVYMTLPEFGETSPIRMNHNGIDRYTLSVTIPSGTTNDTHFFGFYVEDSAGNKKTGQIQVKIDNMPPTPGYMVVNFLTDLPETGVVNLGDILEFIVPITEPDSGSCTIDLKYIGGSVSQKMDYDQVLSRYYLVYETEEATVTGQNYVFKATVTDKAGNSMNSLSSPMHVNCRYPVIDWATVTHINLFGDPNVVNIGDKIVIGAQIPLSLLDGGTPRVDLSKLGGNSKQALFDDGVSSDGAANDGVFGYVHTVTAGDINGETLFLTVNLTDRAGNQATINTNSIFVDNKPLDITSCKVEQIFDNNGNGIVDLDGVYTTHPSVATDVVKISVEVKGDSNDMGEVTVDLTQLGINNVAYPIPLTTISGGWYGSIEVSPMPGSTNGLDVTFKVTATDINGNAVLKDTSNKVKVDNQPPKIEVYPLTFVVDKGIAGEANLGDVLQVRVKVTSNDGIWPQIDFNNLFMANGLTPPSPILIPSSTTIANEYVYKWTVPEGLGTIGSLTVLAYDYSGNMAYGYTDEIQFLSKVPQIANFPSTRANLSKDVIPEKGNKIANPASVRDPVPDEITLRVLLTSVFSINNSPSARVVANIKSIKDPNSGTPFYDDGNPDAWWAKLDYQPAESSPGSYLYKKTFKVEEGGVSAQVASFAVNVLHPTSDSIIIASSIIKSDPDDPFAIDTQLPKPVDIEVEVIEDFDNNFDPNIANIGDYLQFNTKIEYFPDHGSATAILMTNDNLETFRMPLSYNSASDRWIGDFEVKQSGIDKWIDLDGVSYPRCKIIATDASDNYKEKTVALSLKIKNTVPKFADAQLIIDPLHNQEDWVVNVGRGTQTDGIVASMTLQDPLDLYKAYVDFSPVGGSAQYELTHSSSPDSLHSDSFVVAEREYDFATRTFRITAFDRAGNSAYIDKELAVDTVVPFFDSATYDGSTLRIQFNEDVRPDIKLEYIRIGNNMDHHTLDENLVQLNPASDIVVDLIPTSLLTIQLSAETKAQITDWGLRTLYLSMSSLDLTDPVVKDISGNWFVELPRMPATSTIEVIEDYTIRPNLIGGIYDASSSSSKGYLDIYFDKDMDISTISPLSLQELAIWPNRSSALDSFSNRYRFNLAAPDAVNVGQSSLKRLRINISQEAQDWIALNYGRTADHFRLAIRGSAYEPPPSAHLPLIRDISGNRVMPIDYVNATAATLIPDNSQFSVQSAVLDFSESKKMLTISFDSSRRVRLFQDNYRNLADTIELLNENPSDFSKVYLFGNAALESPMALTSEMVELVEYKTLNPDYASSVVRIPLTSKALDTMMKWGVSKFYIACFDGAIKDIWGNGNIRYPVEADKATEINTIFPTSYPAPKIKSVAVSPLRVSADDEFFLLRGVTSGQILYEVAFETAHISGGVYIPIDKSRTPILRLLTEGDPNVERDSALFLGWEQHIQDSITYTVAKFSSTQDLTQSKNIQREPLLIELSNYTDIFSAEKSFADSTSSIFNLEEKITNGFSGSSLPGLLDNQPPKVVAIQPLGTIGAKGAGEVVFTVTFDEPMVQEMNESYLPVLRLGDSSKTVMLFDFAGWTDSDTATFENAKAFDESTEQGKYAFYIFGGYDEAGNKGPENESTGFEVNIMSKGPSISRYEVHTYQSTTAKKASPAGDLIDQPFSPDVLPGKAQIKVFFNLAPKSANNLLSIYDESSTSLVSLPLLVNNLVGVAEWDGSGVDKKKEATYEIRVHDETGNEGNLRGQILYDDLPPKIFGWEFPNLKTFKNKVYYSPSVTPFGEMVVKGNSSGEKMKVRLIKPSVSTDTFLLAEYEKNRYLYNFDGKDSSQTPVSLDNGEYKLSVVDYAGNIAVAADATSKTEVTFVIDTVAPRVAEIKTINANTGAQISSFNPTVNALLIEVHSEDPTIDTDGALIKILKNTTLVKELPLSGAMSPYTAEWDGMDKELLLVEDGEYQIFVSDYAGNVSTDAVKTIEVVSSLFKVETVEQVNKNHIRVIFNHSVNLTDAQLIGNYLLTPAGIGIQTPIVDKNIVILPLNQTLRHNTTYKVKVREGFRSVTGDRILEGNNSGEFIANTQGPQILAVNWEGIKQQNQFNLVYDKELEPKSAQKVENYSLFSNSVGLAIESVTLRADLSSVRVTTVNDIIEGRNYTISAKDVEDLFENKSDPDIAVITFVGRDVTPPELSIAAFSNPANEFDISIIISSDKLLASEPTGTITQSGSVSKEISFNAGANMKLFIAGANLEREYPGIATIRVEGRDNSDNLGTVNLNFTTAFVRASTRAEILSSDRLFKASFAEDTLITDTMLTILEENLQTIKLEESEVGGIVSKVAANIYSSLPKSLTLSVKDSASDLTPLGKGYSVNIPPGRLNKALKLSMCVSDYSLDKKVGLYKMSQEGLWQPVSFETVDKNIFFESDSGGTFALMRDAVAPQVKLLTEVSKEEPLRESKPSFLWQIKDFGSGIDYNTLWVEFEGKKDTPVFDKKTGLARYIATEELSAGTYSISFGASDLAGNQNTMPSLVFDVLPNIKIFEVSQFPNPARNRANLRISTNRNDLSWDQIEVKIYDVSGNLVVDQRALTIRFAPSGLRRNYDLVWDLRSNRGKSVANGVYIAKITLRDPENWNIKTHYTHKLAVLR